MASGFIFAFQLPVGNPNDLRYVRPLLDGVQQALTQVSGRYSLAIHSLAGDLALNDASLRETLHARGILTVGIPRTVEPLTPVPSQEDVRRVLNEAGVHGNRTTHQVHIACACGDSRPVVESLMATLFKAIWSGTAVTEGVLTTGIGELRKVLGETANHSRYIATISRRGYRFIVPLTVTVHPKPPWERLRQDYEPLRRPKASWRRPRNATGRPSCTGSEQICR